MSLLKLKEVLSYEKVCSKIINQSGIVFCALINKKRRRIAGGFGKGNCTFIEEERLQMMYMQFALEFALKKEFDSTLGRIQYIITKRTNEDTIIIPIHENILVIISKPDSDLGEIINNINPFFEQNPKKVILQ